MSEVLDIEVDGEIENRAHGSVNNRSAQWGLPVAIALAGSLVMAVLVLVLLPAMTGSEDRTGLAAKPGDQPSAVPATAAPAPSVTPVDARVSAAQAALAAWGEFVADGDLERLKPWFAEEGPQYRQLAEEAVGLAATESSHGYSVMLQDAVVVQEDKDKAVVAGSVSWVRPMETTQEYGWEVVLQRADDRWLLWTVRKD